MQYLRTLIVDDEPGMRLGIQKALSKYIMRLPDVNEEIGFVIDLAETGEEAIEKINANRPDILLLDYKLPSMSGLEVLEQVTSKDSEMVTIMITAYASLETAVTAIKRGAFDFLAKPFEPAELKKTIAKAAQNLILARHIRKLEQEKRQVRFQFISVLGHELKSPLNAVEGYLNIMNERVSGNDLSAYQQMISRSLLRINGMRKMIADLLDLTRIESGQKKRDLAKHDIIPIVRIAMETALPSAQAKGIRVNLHSPSSIEMNCDPGEIEIVLNNLISNAVKYNRDNGQVDIDIWNEENKVTIAVKDTGVGMTPEESSKLFSEFLRIKNEKTRNIMGSGLGLSIVKKVATLYEGNVTVTSTPDVGSVFTIVLNANTYPSTENDSK
ncbi:MAG: response regulator [Candidatus Marinimicrobia bacterium]|nr:response regulator [Candidatus Neomarinimicrobiota bacterium]